MALTSALPPFFSIYRTRHFLSFCMFVLVVFGLNATLICSLIIIIIIITKTASNSFRLISASLAYLKYVNEAYTSLKLFQAVSVFCFCFTSECAYIWNKAEIKQCCQWSAETKQNFISVLFHNVQRASYTVNQKSKNADRYLCENCELSTVAVICTNRHRNICFIGSVQQLLSFPFSQRVLTRYGFRLPYLFQRSISRRKCQAITAKKRWATGQPFLLVDEDVIWTTRFQMHI